MQTARFLRQIIVKNNQANFAYRSLASQKIDFPKVTLNDLPSPEGDFQTLNNAQQRAYTMHLVVGIGALALTFAFGIGTNMFEAHQDIPQMPDEIECYKDQ